MFFLLFSLHLYTKLENQYVSSVENSKISLFLYTKPAFYLHLPTLSLHLIAFSGSISYLFPLFYSLHSTFWAPFRGDLAFLMPIFPWFCFVNGWRCPSPSAIRHLRPRAKRCWNSSSAGAPYFGSVFLSDNSYFHAFCSSYFLQIYEKNKAKVNSSAHISS